LHVVIQVGRTAVAHVSGQPRQRPVVGALGNTRELAIQVRQPRHNRAVELREKLFGVGNPLDRGSAATGGLETGDGRINQVVATGAQLLDRRSPVRIRRNWHTLNKALPVGLGIEVKLFGTGGRGKLAHQSLVLATLDSFQLAKVTSKAALPPGHQTLQNAVAQAVLECHCMPRTVLSPCAMGRAVMAGNSSWRRRTTFFRKRMMYGKISAKLARPIQGNSVPRRQVGLRSSKKAMLRKRSHISGVMPATSSLRCWYCSPKSRISRSAS